MSEHNDTNEQIPDSPLQTPGEILRAAREGLGLSVDEVANELYMTAYKVRTIESNEFKKLNADAFIRGYLKTYALLLKLDPTIVLQAYDHLGLNVETRISIQPKKASSTKKVLVLMAMLALVLGILWLISVWFLDNRKAQEYKVPMTSGLSSVSTSLQSSSVVVIADPEDAIAVDTDSDELAVNTLAQQPSSVAALLPSLTADISGSNVTAAPAQAVAASSLAASENNAAAQAQTSNAVQPPVQAQQSGALDTLRLVFSEECWLEVIDANGDVLASDLERASSAREIQGQAPFQVKLGNAKAVRMSLNGYDVPIEPRPGTNVRTLKIGR